MPQTQAKLNINQPLVDEGGMAEQVFREWVLRVVDTMVVVGTGTPEGVLEAPQYTLYVDEDTPLVPVQYRKMLPEVGGDRTKGWATV